MVNIDFKNYGGVTGFQPEWLRIQGLSPNNLFQRFIDSAMERNVDIVVVASMHNQKIEQPNANDDFGYMDSSVHDRFSFLKKLAVSSRPGDYSFKGFLCPSNPSIFSVTKNNSKYAGKTVHIINGQVVQSRIPGCDDELDLLVVGANDFEPFSSSQDICYEAVGRGLVVIADQRFVMSHDGKKWLYDNKEKFDAILGHYALACMPSKLAIGPLSNFDRSINTECIRVANILNKSWVSGSGAKRPEWTGLGYTSLDVNPLDNPSKLLSDIGCYLRDHQVGKQHNYGGMGYVNPVSAVLWGYHFKKGLVAGLG